MHKDTEYMIDDKLYIKEIKKCKVYQKVNDYFILRCRIKHRGEKIFKYNIGDLFLEDGNKRYYLTATSEKPIKSVIRSFEYEVEKALKEDDYFKVEYPKDNKTIYAHRIDLDYFYFVEIYREDGEQITEIFENSLDFLGLYKDKYNYEEDSFYKYALSKNDKILQGIIKQYYGKSDETDRKELEKEYKCKVLPCGNENINKTFTLKRDEINLKVLHKSGYGFLHRPYFAMKGHSHDLIELNPYSMCGVDAGKINAELISWNDYVKIVFENKIQ